MAEFLKTQVTTQTQWAPGLVTLQLTESLPEFLPGQFAQLGLDIAGKRVKRSYSIASAPGEAPEFFVSEVKNGELSPSLVQSGENGELFVDPEPLGYFTIDEVPECQTLWLVSTGTGLGPTISMLRTPGALDRFKRVIVIHGARQLDHLAYRDEILERAQKDPRLSYLPCVSREGSNLESFKGRLTTGFAEGFLEQWAGQKFDEQSHMLICGNPHMIDDMSAQLKERGFEKHRRRKPGHYNFERYW